MMIAPAGGGGASPLLLGVGGTGVGVGVGPATGVPDPDPAELDEVVVPGFEVPATGVVDEAEMLDELPFEPVNCVVVVPGDLVRLFAPPHPVTQNAAIL